ncbi:MAG: hypothetical protein ACT4O1_04075 [Gemmatimonadota bacterium]
MSDERRDYFTAFAIGAIVGVGATLLLTKRETGAQRILYELEPALKRARRQARKFGRSAGKRVRRGARRALRDWR